MTPIEFTFVFLAISCLAILCISFLIFLFYFIISAVFCPPFHYPYFTYNFDISGKRSPHLEDYIDQFIIDGHFTQIQQHYKEIETWKIKCENKIEKSLLKKYRRKQYLRCIDDSHAFQFTFSRTQTRYRQVNYVRESYQVSQTAYEVSYSYNKLLERKKQLAAIDYERPLREYNSKEQRKLMTKELRTSVMVRDNYTCQICGKYMPDEVGLQIDHIIPVSKGGKTVMSNLQVTCSKCNGHKKANIYPPHAQNSPERKEGHA